MYKKNQNIDYQSLEEIELFGMVCPIFGSPNYFDVVDSFITKNFSLNLIQEYNIRHLISLILENVCDHGSGSCKMTYGLQGKFYVIEIFEENGGFDLKKLPYGKGGWCYNEMKRSKCLVSHSLDGKKTFVLIANNKADKELH